MFRPQYDSTYLRGRQDYRINKIFLPFSRSAGPAAERQKASSLFKGNRSLIASTKQ